MKKIIAISLLSIYMLSATDLSQLLKTPFLIEHFIEHKEQNNNLTLWQFLCMHYSHEEEDGDYDKDMKLPFKTHGNCNCTTFTANLPVEIFSFLINPPIAEAKILGSYRPSFFSSAYLSTIWQPPQFC